jgi:hypothetical protein
MQITLKPNKVDSSQLNRKRRDALHQIICRADISPRTRIIARSIARLEVGYIGRNGIARSSTCSSDMTIRNEPRCYDLAAITAAVAELTSAGQLRVTKRENGIRNIHLVRRDDIDVYLPPISGDREFWHSDAWKDQKAQRELLADAIFTDPALTDGQKLVGYAIIVLADPHTLECSEPRVTIARIVGVDKATAVRAVPRLAERGYVTQAGKAIVICLPAVQARCKPGADAVQSQSQNINFTDVSSPPSVDSVGSMEDDEGKTYDSEYRFKTVVGKWNESTPRAHARA